MNDKILGRIERSAGVADLVSILTDRLSPSDLHSLLLEVYRRRVSRRRASDILSEYETNRFVRPSAASPAALLAWEKAALESLPGEFEAIELSPVCPAGTISVLGGLNQDWAVTTIRSTEVVSDSTNVLALECAVRRRERLRSASTAAEPVHLATSHRLLRAQKYDDPTLLASFRVFCMCSAGRNSPGRAFKEQAILRHVRFYLGLIRRRLGSDVPLRFAASDFGQSRRRKDVATRMADTIANEFPDVRCSVDADRTAGHGYYEDLCFRIFARTPEGEELDLADGGGVRWMQDLLGSSKERLVISGLGSERSCTLFADRAAELRPGEPEENR